jgi:hypothetical protein
MSFRTFLDNHYVVACNLQRGISRDPQMIAMLRDGPPDAALVKSWMRDYSLFQGITGQSRDAIANCFLDFARSHARHSSLSDEVVKELYADLFTALYRQLARSWMSATSKLLWCLYPEDIVIYDAFVHRTLVVMRCIDSDLSEFPRIGAPPAIKSKADVASATAHYMTYQAMVRKLQAVHAKALSDLRQCNNETYPYDIRIIDKLLWMIGDSKRSY